MALAYFDGIESGEMKMEMVKALKIQGRQGYSVKRLTMTKTLIETMGAKGLHDQHSEIL